MYSIHNYKILSNANNKRLHLIILFFKNSEIVLAIKIAFTKKIDIFLY